MPSDGTRTKLRRVGWTGPLIELLPPMAALAYLLWAQVHEVLYLAAAAGWLLVVLVQVLVSRLAQLVVDGETLRHESRLGELGRILGLDWELPLDGMRCELMIGEGGLPYFRPWQVHAIFISPGHEPRTLSRLLDWVRTHVPTDPLNRSRLSEKVRASREDPLDALRQYPLVRVLEDREVRVEMATADNLAEAVAESRERRREAVREQMAREEEAMAAEPARSVEHSRDPHQPETPLERAARDKQQRDLFGHGWPVAVMVIMGAAAVYAFVDSVILLEEGLASWHGLMWLPLAGAALTLPLAAPVMRSGLHGPGGVGLLLVAWLVLSLCSYPLVIRYAQAAGEEPGMVDYSVRETGVLEPRESGWPVVYRFRLHEEYWESMPEDATYPLEMRRAPGDIFLVNVARVHRSQQQFYHRQRAREEEQ